MLLLNCQNLNYHSAEYFSSMLNHFKAKLSRDNFNSGTFIFRDSVIDVFVDMYIAHVTKRGRKKNEFSFYFYDSINNCVRNLLILTFVCIQLFILLDSLIHRSRKLCPVAIACTRPHTYTFVWLTSD